MKVEIDFDNIETRARRLIGAQVTMFEFDPENGNIIFGAITQFNLKTKTQTGVWVTEHAIECNSTQQSAQMIGNIFELGTNTMFKIEATPSAGSSSCVAIFETL